MRGAERIVHIEVAQRGQLSGKGRIVFRFAGMESDVLQHHDVAVAHSLHRGLDRRADAVVHVFDRPAHQGGQPVGERRRAIGIVHLAFRAAEVGHQDHTRAALDQVLKRRDGFSDSGVVDDSSVLDGDVEIDPHEDSLARNVHVADGGFVEGAAGRGVRGQFSRSPMKTVRSTTRQE